MDKISMFFKSVVGVVGSFWSFLVGSLGFAFPTLIVLMAVDFITGLMVGSKEGKLNSSIGRNGFFKKMYVLMLIGAAYLMERVVFQTQHLGDGVTIAYIIIEFISIAENGGKLGAPIGPIKKVIAVLKDKEVVKK